MTAPRPNTVSVFGSGDPRPGEAAYETARAVGRALAELGYAIVNGGYGGTMEASARGAREAGGSAVGVLCSLWRSRPNAYLDSTVTTDDLYARVRKLIEMGTAGYVVLPGATGTLVEIALVWELLCKRLLPRRPLVCVGRFWQPVIESAAAMRPGSRDVIACVDEAGELRRFFPPPREADGH